MFAVSSMTLPLKKVALKQPGCSIKTADPQKCHYGKYFDPEKLEAVEQINNSWMETDHFKSYFGASLEVKAT